MNVPGHLEAGRHIVQHLAHVGPNLAQRAFSRGAGAFGRAVLDIVPVQMSWQGPTALAGRGRPHGGRFGQLMPVRLGRLGLDSSSASSSWAICARIQSDDGPNCMSRSRANYMRRCSASSTLSGNPASAIWRAGRSAERSFISAPMTPHNALTSSGRAAMSMGATWRESRLRPRVAPTTKSRLHGDFWPLGRPRYAPIQALQRRPAGISPLVRLTNHRSR